MVNLYRSLGDLSSYVGAPNNTKPSIYRTASPYIHAGLDQMNVIKVKVVGDRITMFLNNNSVDSIQDDAYSEGQIGLEAGNHGNATDVKYTNLKVWKV